ncbi:S8 family serine peptidase, partial [Streptomyces sp. NPDC005122]
GGTELCETHGTSDATAIASASAALIWSKHANWSNNQVLRVMLNTASSPKSGNERTDYLGYGAVRPRIALTDPGDPGPADVYPLPDLKSVASKTPGSSASASPKHEGAAPIASSESDGVGSATPWILAGVGGSVLVGAAFTAWSVRRRRRAAAAARAHSAAQEPTQGVWPFGGT